MSPSFWHAVGASCAAGPTARRCPSERTPMSSEAGTPENPWTLKTPPLSSTFQAWFDTVQGVDVVVVRVGSTVLHYDRRCLDDLQAMLAERKDWVELGSADEQKEAKPGTVEAWGRSPGQSGRRVVRAQEGLARPVRHVRPAADGTARPGGGRTQRPEQPDARTLTPFGNDEGPRPCGRGPSRRSPDGIRTRATALRGRRARPLHNGAVRTREAYRAGSEESRWGTRTRT